jgi:hypothetical protein
MSRIHVVHRAIHYITFYIILPTKKYSTDRLILSRLLFFCETFHAFVKCVICLTCLLVSYVVWLRQQHLLQCKTSGSSLHLVSPTLYYVLQPYLVPGTCFSFIFSTILQNIEVTYKRYIFVLACQVFSTSPSNPPPLTATCSLFCPCRIPLTKMTIIPRFLQH